MSLKTIPFLGKSGISRMMFLRSSISVRSFPAACNIIFISHFSRFSQFFQRLDLDLPNPLARNAKLLADGVQGLRFVVIEPKTQGQYFLFTLRKHVEMAGHLLIATYILQLE